MTRRLTAIVAGLVVAAGCGGNGPPPGPVGGEMTISLTAGHNRTGAILLQLNGPVIDITGLNGYRVSSAPIGLTGSTRVVVTGAIVSGDMLRVRIPDVALLPAYTMFIEQAAARDDFSLLDPGGYGLTRR